jgi:two-component system sensor histidine kinase KdpD
VRWTEQDQRELLAAANSALDRLTALVTNLLDMSRLEADALSLACRPVGLDDVVSHALATFVDGDQVTLDVSPELPEVIADPGLLERVIANVVENAMRYTPEGERVRVAASAYAGTVELRIIDRGPGVPRDARLAVFEAFQRRDDRAVSTGSSVGLAACHRPWLRPSDARHNNPGGHPRSAASVSARTAELIGGSGT